MSGLVPYFRGLFSNDPLATAFGLGLMIWLPIIFVLIVISPCCMNSTVELEYEDYDSLMFLFILQEL